MWNKIYVSVNDFKHPFLLAVCSAQFNLQCSICRVGWFQCAERNIQCVLCSVDVRQSPVCSVQCVSRNMQGLCLVGPSMHYAIMCLVGVGLVPGRSPKPKTAVRSPRPARPWPPQTTVFCNSKSTLNIAKHSYIELKEDKCLCCTNTPTKTM